MDIYIDRHRYEVEVVMVWMFFDQARVMADQRQAEARRARLIRSLQRDEASRRRLARRTARPVAATTCCSEA